MSFTEISTVSIGDGVSTNVIEDNIAFLTTGTTTKITEVFSSTDISSYTAPVKDGIGALFAAGYDVRSVYIVEVKTGEEDSFNNLLEDNNIWACVIASPTLNTPTIIPKLLTSMGVQTGVLDSGRGILFSLITSASVPNPLAVTASRLAYFRTTEYQPVGMLCAKVLSQKNKSFWGNATLGWQTQLQYSKTDLEAWAAKNINSFQRWSSNGKRGTDGSYNMVRFVNSVTSTGEQIGDVYIKDRYKNIFRVDGESFLVDQREQLFLDVRGLDLIENFVFKKLSDLGDDGYLRVIDGAEQDDTTVFAGARSENARYNFEFSIDRNLSANDLASRRVPVHVKFQGSGQVVSLHFNSVFYKR